MPCVKAVNVEHKVNKTFFHPFLTFVYIILPCVKMRKGTKYNLNRHIGANFRENRSEVYNKLHNNNNNNDAIIIVINNITSSLLDVKLLLKLKYQGDH